MNFHVSLDSDERPVRGFVRFDGATGRADDSVLSPVSAALLGVEHVHVDLGAMDCVPFTLVAWLLHEHRSIHGRGGRLSVGHAPADLSRILSSIGRPGSLELTDARL